MTSLNFTRRIAASLVGRWIASFAFLYVAFSASLRAAPVLHPHEFQTPFAIGPIKPDATRNVVYIVDRDFNRILAIDTGTGQQVYAADIEDGQTDGDIAISVDGTKLYLAESTEDKILVFSLPTLTPLPLISLSFSPTSIASAANGRLFAGLGGQSGSLAEINPADGSILHAFGTSGEYYYYPLLRTNADGTNLYATSSSLSGFLNLYKYNLSGGQISAYTPYMYESENLVDFQPDETKGRVYLMSGGIYGVNVLLTATDDYSTEWPLTSPYGEGVSFNEQTNVVFGMSGSPYGGDIREYSRTDGTPLADFPVVQDTYTLQTIAATANGFLLYVRSDFDESPTFLGLLNSTGNSVTLVPTIDQTITFDPISSGNTGSQVPLQATSNSGLTVTYYVVSGPATINGNILTYTGPGTVVVAATQAGDQIFKPKTITQSINVALVTQSLSPFVAVPSKTFGGTPFGVVVPWATSGLPVSVRVKSGPATIRNNLVTLTGAGTVMLGANQPGDGHYASAAEVTTSFAVSKAHQTIKAFAPVGSRMYTSTPFAISLPTASSSLPVTVTVQSGPATISGNIITPTGIGAVTLVANQAGNANFQAATTVSTLFNVTQATQTITPFKTIPAKTYSTAPFSIVLPTSSSGLPVDVTVVSGPAQLSGSNLTLTGIGTVVLAANQSGNSFVSAAPQITTTFTVKQATQVIGPFNAIVPHAFGDAPFQITLPTSISGLPVTVAVTSGPATLVNNVVTITGIGTVTLAANQAGNVNYSAAKTVTTSFVVNREAQTIAAFNTISAQTFGVAPFAVAIPTASSNLPVTIKVKSGPAKLTGTTLTVTAPGTVTLAADQAGDTTFAPAPEVTTSFVVNKQAQTITAFNAIGTQTFGAAPLSVATPTASSALPVTVSVLSGPATISRGAVTLTGAGTVVLAADQAGNANFAAATQVTTSFVVNPAAQSLAAFSAIPAKVFGVAPFAVTAPAATSKLPVSLSILSGPASIGAGKITLTGVGTVVVAANQAGNANYTAASQVTTSFTVAKASQSIKAFARIPAKTASTAPFSIVIPTASSGLAVAVTVQSGPATISGSTVTITGSGTVVLAADQVGDSNYNAAPEVTTSFVVR